MKLTKSQARQIVTYLSRKFVYYPYSAGQCHGILRSSDYTLEKELEEFLTDFQLEENIK